MSENKYEYNQLGCHAKRVGQAVVDILAKDNHPILTAGEITDAQAEKYRQSLEEAIETGKKLYKSPFYILVVTNKEFWAENVVRNWFIPRQTPPFATTLYQFYPNHMKTLYMIDTDRGNLKICWSIPGVEDMLTISLKPFDYDRRLVDWIKDFTEGNLDREKYSFDHDLVNNF